MILLHKSLKRSDDIMKSLRRYFEVNCKTIDGVIEVFNNNIGQGYMLKMYETFDRSKDLVLWIFQSLQEKKIKIAFSIFENIDENNNWIDEEKVNFKTYPIVKDIKIQCIKDIHSIICDYYGLNEKIDMTKDFSI